jgi:hypothetical protein
MPACRARECLRDTIDGDKGASFSLIPDWIDRVKKADNSTYIQLKTTVGMRLQLAEHMYHCTCAMRCC